MTLILSGQPDSKKNIPVSSRSCPIKLSSEISLKVICEKSNFQTGFLQ